LWEGVGRAKLSIVNAFGGFLFWGKWGLYVGFGIVGNMV